MDASSHVTPTERPAVHICYFVSCPRQPYGRSPKSHTVTGYVRVHHTPMPLEGTAPPGKDPQLNQLHRDPCSPHLTAAPPGSERTPPEPEVLIKESNCMDV